MKGFLKFHTNVLKDKANTSSEKILKQHIWQCLLYLSVCLRCELFLPPHHWAVCEHCQLNTIYFEGENRFIYVGNMPKCLKAGRKKMQQT